MRPLVKPALRRLWRDPATLQLGLTPEHAVVLTGLELGDLAVLELLDGTREVPAILATAAQQGHAPPRVSELIGVLTGARAVDDGPLPAAASSRLAPDLLSLSLMHPAPGEASAVIAHRHDATIAVCGAGRVGAALAALLGAAGVGTVAVDDDRFARAADLSPAGIRAALTPAHRPLRRGEATRALLAGRSRPPAAPGSAGASLVVLAPAGSTVPPEALHDVRSRSHLPVLVRETSAIIGPLVLPGLTPCLRCDALARSDRDPAWPSLSAQLMGSPTQVEASDIALATLAAALGALQVLAWLDQAATPAATPGAPPAAVSAAPGRATLPPVLGAVLEFGLIDLRLRRRTVRAHPDCGCGAADGLGAA